MGGIVFQTISLDYTDIETVQVLVVDEGQRRL